MELTARMFERSMLWLWVVAWSLRSVGIDGLEEVACYLSLRNPQLKDEVAWPVSACCASCPWMKGSMVVVYAVW